MEERFVIQRDVRWILIDPVICQKLHNDFASHKLIQGIEWVDVVLGSGLGQHVDEVFKETRNT